MALVQGDVRVTVGVTGKGDTSVVKQAGKDIAKIGTSTDAATKQVGGLGTQLKGLWGVMRQAANIIPGLGISGMIGAAFTGISALIDGITGSEARAAEGAKAWAEEAKRTGDAIRGAESALDRFHVDPLSAALGAINSQLSKARGDAEKTKSSFELQKPILLDINRLTALQAALERGIANDTAATADNLALILKRMAERERLTVPLISPFTGNADDLALHHDLAGTAYTDEQWAARQKRLSAALAGQRARGGGGQEVDKRRAQRGDFFGQDQPQGQQFQSTQNHDWMYDPTADEAEVAKAKALGGAVRDFASALSDALPGMDAFSAALGRISQMWGDYAETGKGAATATIKSAGAMALAGAEAIKNDRLRAGVLSVFHLGLGTALLFNPVTAAEGAAHIAGGLILGGIALASGGGGGGHSSGPKARQVARAPLSDRTQSGGVTFIVNGTYIAGHSAQETAADLHAMMQRGGSGFVPRAA